MLQYSSWDTRTDGPGARIMLPGKMALGSTLVKSSLRKSGLMESRGGSPSMTGDLPFYNTELQTSVTFHSAPSSVYIAELLRQLVW